MVVGNSGALHFRFVFSLRRTRITSQSRTTEFLSEWLVYRIYRRHGPHMSLVNKALCDRDITRICRVYYYLRTVNAIVWLASLFVKQTDYVINYSQFNRVTLNILDWWADKQRLSCQFKYIISIDFDKIWFSFAIRTQIMHNYNIEGTDTIVHLHDHIF